MMRLTVVLSVLALVGCAMVAHKSEVTPVQHKAENALTSGIEKYDDGNYADAIANLQDALTQGLSTDDQVRAHKYMAFAYCVSGKPALCREEFKKAVELNPALELSPSEAGHPTWGPIFKSVKGKKTEAKK